MANEVFDTTEYPSLANVQDRTAVGDNIERVFFGEGNFSQAADQNEAFSREALARKEIGNLVASDGDRIEGCAVVVDTNGGTITIGAGVIYLAGRPRPIDEAVLTGMDLGDDVQLGVYMTETPITAEDNPAYYGQYPGTDSYAEVGAVRTALALAWGYDGDGQSGTFYAYSLVRDGVEVSVQAPTNLSGVQQQVALADMERNGHYVIEGFEVTALELTGDTLELSVAAGVARVNGQRVQRSTDTALTIDADSDVEEVSAEPQTYVDDGGSCTFTVNHPPLAAVSSVIIPIQRVDTLVKGAADGVDSLPVTGVTKILSVVQGGTTYVATTDYVKTGDGVDWGPAGGEPALGSTYDVTYIYLDEVSVDSATDETITVSGGVDGETAFLAYSFKVPRHDRIVLATDGSISLLKGSASRSNPQPPKDPGSTLALAVLRNDWFDVPEVENRAKRLTVDDEIDLKRRVNDLVRLVGNNRLSALASGRNPGQTLGVFVDPLSDDSYRDAGYAQGGAVFDGSLQLGIDETIVNIDVGEMLTLSYTKKRTIYQGLATTCVKINRYQNFNPLPAKLTITPARDFWTEYQTRAVSAKAQVIGSGNLSRVLSTSTSLSTTTAPLAFLRQIDVDFRIEKFGAGETLDVLTFDGKNVNPGGLVANGSGVITGTFTIPAKVKSGTKRLYAEGGSGASAVAIFRGEGKIERTTRTTRTVVQRFAEVASPAVPNRASVPGFTGSLGEAPGYAPDPQAQTFVYGGARFVPAVLLRFCNIGNRDNDVIVEIVSTNESFEPSTYVLASQRIDMQSAVVGVDTVVDFDLPVYAPAGTYLAIVVKTNDADHSISLAELGEFDAAKQQRVTKQPYTGGNNFDGADARAWKLYPGRDLTFGVYECVFSPTTRTVQLGTYAVTDVSDIMIQADVFIPDEACSVYFRVTAGLQVYTVAEGQNIELTDYYTGDLKIEAILTGTAETTPVVSSEMTLVLGSIHETDIYVSRVWAMGDPVDIQGSLSTKLPTGSAVTVELDKVDDTWTAMSFTGATPIDEGFTERTYALAGYEASAGGRLKITLTGGAGARPSVCDINFGVGA